MKDILVELYDTIENRKEVADEKSYTAYLFKEGTDKILKKVGEECTETIIAAKNHDKEELVYEISDLIYHVMVLMASENLTLSDIEQELEKRTEKSGNLKEKTKSNKNS